MTHEPSNTRSSLKACSIYRPRGVLPTLSYNQRPLQRTLQTRDPGGQKGIESREFLGRMTWRRWSLPACSHCSEPSLLTSPIFTESSKGLFSFTCFYNPAFREYIGSSARHRYRDGACMTRCQRDCASSPHPILLRDTIYRPANTCDACTSPSSHPHYFESICFRPRIQRRGEDDGFFDGERNIQCVPYRSTLVSGSDVLFCQARR